MIQFQQSQRRIVFIYISARCKLREYWRLCWFVTCGYRTLRTYDIGEVREDEINISTECSIVCINNMYVYRYTCIQYTLNVLISMCTLYFTVTNGPRAMQAKTARVCWHRLYAWFSWYTQCLFSVYWLRFDLLVCISLLWFALTKRFKYPCTTQIRIWYLACIHLWLVNWKMPMSKNSGWNSFFFGYRWIYPVVFWHFDCIAFLTCKMFAWTRPHCIPWKVSCRKR